MKLFTDPSGKFQMLVPIQMQYKNPSFERNEGQPHAFGNYDNMVGAFQISCKHVTPHIAELITQKRLPIQLGGPVKVNFHEHFFEHEDIHSYTWMAAVEDHFFLATFIYEVNELEKAKVVLEEVKTSLGNLRYILPEHRDAKLAERRVTLFMASTAALIDLRNKALENGSFIELVVLTANRIDGMLRLAIILTNQLERANSEIDIALLFQGEQDKPVMERKIYQQALDRNIINQLIFDELEELYIERNKVVHRYIITDIRTEQVINIVFRYYALEDKIDSLINKLEVQQFSRKIGMNADVEPGKISVTQMEVLKSSIRDKHGYIEWMKKD